MELSTHLSLKGHPSLAKLIGYCCEDEVKGVVYDLNPLCSLQNLTARGNFHVSCHKTNVFETLYYFSDILLQMILIGPKELM